MPAQPEEFTEATTWRPDRGEHRTTLDGRLKRVGVVEGMYGPYPVLELETGDGELWAFHAFRDMAREELANLQPQIGDPISIHYGGRSEKGYYRYRIRSLDGKQSEIDWSRFEPDPRSAGEQPGRSPSDKSVSPAAVADDEQSQLSPSDKSAGPAAADDDSIPF
jgi:hypothetical protein